MDGSRNARKMRERKTCLACYSVRAPTSSRRQGEGPGSCLLSAVWLFDLNPRQTLMTTASTPSHRDQTL